MNKFEEQDAMFQDLTNRVNYWIVEGDYSPVELVGVLESIKMGVLWDTWTEEEDDDDEDYCDSDD